MSSYKPVLWRGLNFNLCYHDDHEQESTFRQETCWDGSIFSGISFFWLPSQQYQCLREYCVKGTFAHLTSACLKHDVSILFSQPNSLINDVVTLSHVHHCPWSSVHYLSYHLFNATNLNWSSDATAQMRLRKSVNVPARYKGHDELAGPSQRRDRTQPLYPELLSAQTVPHHQELPAAAFPSLPLVGKIGISANAQELPTQYAKVLDIGSDIALIDEDDLNESDEMGLFGVRNAGLPISETEMSFDLADTENAQFDVPAHEQVITEVGRPDHCPGQRLRTHRYLLYGTRSRLLFRSTSSTRCSGLGITMNV